MLEGTVRKKKNLISSKALIKAQANKFSHCDKIMLHEEITGFDVKDRQR
jgi:hypothetical protein